MVIPNRIHNKVKYVVHSDVSKMIHFIHLRGQVINHESTFEESFVNKIKNDTKEKKSNRN